MHNFHLLEVGVRGSETQHQVGENLNKLSELESKIIYFFHKKYIVIHIKYIKLVND